MRYHLSSQASREQSPGLAVDETNPMARRPLQRQKDRVLALVDRVSYLAEKVKQAKAEGRSGDRANRERVALEWALSIIRRALWRSRDDPPSSGLVVAAETSEGFRAVVWNGETYRCACTACNEVVPVKSWTTLERAERPDADDHVDEESA